MQLSWGVHGILELMCAVIWSGVGAVLSDEDLHYSVLVPVDGVDKRGQKLSR